jgi:HNH endonuclease
LTKRGASHQELTDAATRLAANARSRETERARRDRIRQLRNFRVRQCPEGGVRGEFFCDEVAWARVYPALEADAKALWKAAGMVEPLDAYRCDAFLAQLGGPGYCSDYVSAYISESDSDTGGRGGGGGRGGNRTARPHILLIIDAAALRRGTTEEGEVCEIEGIGPVSVEAATELLGEGSVQFIVREGVDIRTVTSTSRTIPQRVGAALVVRDRSCAAGCGKRHGLEGDHRVVDFGDDGPTELDNLARLCPSCHDLKTYGGWRLEGSAGKWKWVAPAHPKSAFYIARARQLAAARAKAMAEAQRNDPLRQ